MPENAPPLRANERRPSNARPPKHTSKEEYIMLKPIYNYEFDLRSDLWALLPKQTAADAPTLIILRSHPAQTLIFQQPFQQQALL